MQTQEININHIRLIDRKDVLHLLSQIEIQKNVECPYCETVKKDIRPYTINECNRCGYEFRVSENSVFKNYGHKIETWLNVILLMQYDLSISEMSKLLFLSENEITLLSLKIRVKRLNDAFMMQLHDKVLEFRIANMD